MTRFQLTLLRVISVAAATLFAVDWLSLAARLEIARSTEAKAIANRSTFKGVPVTYLSQLPFGEIRVPCSDAAPLCTVPHHADVKIWLQRPAFLHDYWVVAADYKGMNIIAPDLQNGSYREAKIMWGLGTLAAILVAVALVKFPPDVENGTNET